MYEEPSPLGPHTLVASSTCCLRSKNTVQRESRVEYFGEVEMLACIDY
jgi:hypothetical protein